MKTIRRIFILCFFGMLVIPLLFTNRREGAISETENRRLASPAAFYKDDGSPNENYLQDVSAWLEDNIGFREELIHQHAEIQYHLFGNLIYPIYRMGPRGEWNYVGENVLPDYQQTNLLSEKELNRISESFETVNEYLQSRGIQFYYVQCRDKQSVYPEEFPASVNQYGTVSRTDQIVKHLGENTSLRLVDTKEVLTEAKQQYDTYTPFGDPAHWSSRGAYIGYQEIMCAINGYNGDRYPVLMEDDYDLTPADKGFDMPGNIHRTQMEESFAIRKPAAVLTNEKFTIDADDERDAFYTNDVCGNGTRVLIIGDSYIQLSILDDFAESFHETAMIWKEKIADIQNLADAYHPDIVIYEQAERELDFEPLMEAADSIRGQQEAQAQ